MALPSIMPPQKNFAEVPPRQAYQRSVFNRSHGHKTTFNSGFLVPFYVDEILPGDSQDLRANIFARISSTLDFPIMDNLFLDTFYFFIPNRILWTNWERFLGAKDTQQITPTPNDFVIPTVAVPAGTGFLSGSLYDYLGIPPGQHVDESDDKISNLFARAYNLVWNEWFRDQNLQDKEETDFLSDGPDDPANYVLKLRNKKHDYITACLPWPQKGEPVTIAGGVEIPAYEADVYGNGNTLGVMSESTTGMEYAGWMFENTSGISRGRFAQDLYNTPLDDSANTEDPFTNGNGRKVGITDIVGESGMVAAINAIPATTAISINALREAFTLQQYLELNARGGTRYTEYLKSHFGVTVPDYRLQRPEYLGGGSQMITINPVHQTTPAATPTIQDALGAQAAYVTMSARSGYSKSFLEHGIVLGLVNVRADITYQQGLHKMFTRQTALEFFDPIFANLGEQAVLNQELFYQDDVSIDEDVFGYQERWSEYRYLPSRLSGLMRSNPTSGGSLDAWHLSEDFASLPVLNSNFIGVDVPLPRVMSVSSGVPEIIFDSYIQLKHARLMPVYSVPGLMRL